MKRKLLLSMMLMFLLVSTAWAQRTITGTVTSADGTLPGATVQIKGTQQGTQTDIEGKYTITVPEGNDVLVFRYVGYNSIEEKIANRTVIDVILQEDQLSEVVVTGVAIEREKEELGFAVTQISGEETIKARDPNVLNSLSGKVPGLQITQQSGTVGGSSKVVLREPASLTGDIQPLFVVDGVPIFNSNIAAGGSAGSRISGGFDTGNRAQDINADDIESVTVLKGAAAAALYGQRARNGVIMITTKKGKKGKGVITFNSSLRFDTPARLPDYQNEYGPGTQGKYFYDASGETRWPPLNGWGPRIEGQSVPDWKNDTVSLVAQPNNVKDFYEVGQLYINSLSFAAGNENSDYRLSYTNLTQRGMIPNSQLARNTLSLNAGTKVNSNLTARLGLNYINTYSQGRAAQGSNDSDVLTSTIHFLPRTIAVSDLKDYLNPDGSQIQLSEFTDNPYWTINNNIFKNNVDRLFGFALLEFTPIASKEWIKVTARGGLDNVNEYRRRVRAAGSIGLQQGEFSEILINQKQLNFDVFASAERNVSDKIKLRGLIGYNLNQRDYRENATTASQLSVADLYTFSNANIQTPTNRFERRRLYGVYADATIGYNEYLFLNLTARNDWSSTLPQGNNSYFYPSANVSFVFSKALGLEANDNSPLTFGKLRIGIAQVGSDTNPYSLAFRYLPQSDYFGQFSTGNDYPFGGLTAFSSTSVNPPLDLQPEIQNSFEIGTELGFFEGKLRLDLNYYNIVTNRQIVRLTVPTSTGFRRRELNAGAISNRGVEILVSGKPIKTTNFSWELVANFSSNKNTIDDLPEGLEQFGIASAFSGLEVRAVEGEEIGLYGSDWLRDSVSGKPVIDPLTGLRTIGNSERLGDLYPDFNLGIQNNFTYKGFSLSFLIDWQQGGVLYSNTVQQLRSTGLAIETAENREGTFIDDGVIVEGETTRPNDVPVQSMQAFWQNHDDVLSTGVFDASYVKLREMRIAYSLPKSLVSKTPFTRISLGLEGRNLLLLNSQIPHIDPETNLFGSSSNGLGVEWNNVPLSRSYGFNIFIQL